jgi:hypothetical protein
MIGSYLSACRHDRPVRLDSSVFQAAPPLPRQLPRQAEAAAQHRPVRRNGRDNQRIGSTPRHWPFQYLRLRTQLSAAPITRSRVSFWHPPFGSCKWPH